eukprot:TRINITY_DN7507_c0_g1_i8.p3 TRINITY_DN7507_c0_g1~~TRINITY_DN7507_c0_g1_i8.p3  ORF type:complete len:104 (+),score=23.05 TRINITY_DN7507_c0_g1_i8:1264-1575(+)
MLSTQHQTPFVVLQQVLVMLLRLASAFEPTTTKCRVANGVCDVAEFCTGSGSTCPADGFAPATTVCQESDLCDLKYPVNTVCDLVEKCDGTSNASQGYLWFVI